MSQQETYELDLPSDFNDYEWEVEKKGWFGDVRLACHGKHYTLNFYDPTRLNQEAEDHVASDSYFFEQNLVIVKSVNENNMRSAAKMLLDNGQIEKLKSDLI